MLVKENYVGKKFSKIFKVNRRGKVFGEIELKTFCRTAAVTTEAI